MDALIGFDLVIYREILALIIIRLEGVTAVTLHMTVVFWCPPIGKEYGHLVDGLWCQGEKISKHVRIF